MLVERKENRTMTKAIYFDMDGTIANLYGVENWLPMLRNEDTTPYAKANPMVNMNSLARILNKLHTNGWTLGIVSWTAKSGTDEYNERVRIEKIKWLKTHLTSVKFDEIHIVKYGTPKEEIVSNPMGILFDDEEQNRTNWKGIAYDVNEIIETLKGVA